MEDDPRLSRLGHLHAENATGLETGLFTRRLALVEGVSDGTLVRQVRWTDYQILAASLREQLARVGDEWLKYHEMEAAAIVGMSADGHGLLPYIADLGRALGIAETIGEPATSALPLKPTSTLRAKSLRL